MCCPLGVWVRVPLPALPFPLGFIHGMVIVCRLNWRSASESALFPFPLPGAREMVGLQ